MTYEYVDEFLAHHGIKGQRWGVRNGPPYPLKAGDHSASEKKANWRSSLSNKVGGGTSATSKARNYMTPSEKKQDRMKALSEALISAGVGTVVAASTITAFADASGVPVTPKMLAPAVIAAGLAATTPYIRHTIASKKEKAAEEWRSNAPLDKKTGLHLKTENLTEKEDAQRINPGFKNMYRDTKNNCTMCSAAYDLRRRGYDVVAQKSPTGYEPENSFEKWYKGAKQKRIKIDPYAHMQVENMLSKEPEGSRGALVLYSSFGGGHAVAYEITDGKINVIDGQCGKTYDVTNVDRLAQWGGLSHVGYYRLDNLEPNYATMRKVAVK